MGPLSRTLGALLILGSAGLFAQTQEWEIGGAGGYAFAKTNNVSNDTASGEAGFRSGYIVSAVAGNHMWRFLSGEVRYVYRKGPLKVNSDGGNATLAGDSHAVSYDLLLHTASREAKVRPYVAFGGGIKIFRGRGEESEYQPGRELAVLTKTQQNVPLLSVGGGVSVRLSSFSVLRLDFRDHITPFPTEVILPAPGAKVHGFLHDFLPLVGISLTF